MAHRRRNWPKWRSEEEHFDCATWLHKAQQLPKEEFKQEVERPLAGKETEPYEIIYLKLYKDQLAVVEQALETGALMLGIDKSRGYCLEMICADFLGGASLESPNLDALRFSISRLLLLPSAGATAGTPAKRCGYRMSGHQKRRPRLQLDPAEYRQLHLQVLRRDGWRCQNCGRSSHLQVHHIQSRGRLGPDAEENLVTLCASCHPALHNGREGMSAHTEHTSNDSGCTV